MKLLQIAKGRWEVLAAVDPQGRCPVLDLIDPSAAAPRDTRLFLSRFLRVYLPLEGPPSSSLPRCRPSTDGVFELRGQPGEQAPAVLFFADGGQRIVCTDALSSRQLYFEAKSAQGLEISEAP